MRLLVSALTCLLLVGPARAEEKDKRKKGEDAVKVITLDRKTPVAYEKEIEPIFVNKCNFCHSGNVKEGKLDLSSYETLMRGGKRGSAVTPGKAAESLLYKVSSKDHRPYMPPRSEKPLSPQELALVKLWIDQGAKAPAGGRVITKVVLKAPAASVTPVLGVALSPDKESVAAARGNQALVWEVKTGKLLRTLIDPKLVGPDKKPVSAAHLSLVESIAWSKDGKFLATGSYQEVVLWDAKTGELKHRVTGFADRVVCLAFSHDHKTLAAGGGEPTQEGELKLIEVATGKVAKHIKDNIHSDTIFGVAFSPDDKMVVSGGADKFVKTFDVSSGKFLKAFEGHTDHVLGVGFSGDGKLIASGGADKLVKVWDYAKGEQVRTITNAHAKQVTALVYIGKTNTFATAGGEQGVRFWNANGGNFRNFPAGNDFQYCVAVSGDESLLAAGGQDGTVRLYNGKSGALLRSLAPGGEKDKDKKPAEKKKAKK